MKRRSILLTGLIALAVLFVPNLSAVAASAETKRYEPVVTDDGPLSGAINLLKWTLHGHVRTFQDAEFDVAVGWVSG